MNVAVQQLSFQLNLCKSLYFTYLYRYLYVLVPKVCYIHLGFYDLLSPDQDNWPAPHDPWVLPDNSGEPQLSSNSFSAAWAELASHYEQQDF